MQYIFKTNRNKMKKQIQKMTKGALVLVAVFLTITLSCNSQVPQNDLIGSWETGSTKITLREKTGWMKYKFTSANIKLTLKINPDNSVNGQIGNVSFKDATLTKNKGNSSSTGISYIVSCGLLDHICAEDITGPKKIELWLMPTKNNGVLQAEIRLIDGWDTFPMGEAQFNLKTTE
jgi:hypothetical protein